MILIGLTGERQVGKSVLADHLVAEHGFSRLHPFDGGKAATQAFFRHLGADADTAWRMVNGDLKDRPSHLLPVGPDGVNFDPRFFMEKFGAFMGVILGPDWTLNQEIRRLADQGSDRIIAESIAFEAEAFRAAGGIVVGVKRPRAGPIIAGIETDRVVAGIVPDLTFHNATSDKRAAGPSFADFLGEHGILELPAPAEELPEPM